MGTFISKNIEGIKFYDVFSKQTFKDIYALERLMPLYSFEPEGAFEVREIYYDSPAKLLDRAGLTLCKVVEKDKAYFKVEKQLYLPTNSVIKVREEKIYVEEINPNDSVIKHSFALIDGITSMFSTQFSIDLENVLKTVVPRLEIVTKANAIKVFSGNGFKSQMDFEDVTFINYETKKNAKVFMMKIQLKTSSIHLSYFDEFTSKLEKFCKSIIPIKDSKYQIALRLTKQAPPPAK